MASSHLPQQSYHTFSEPSGSTLGSQTRSASPPATKHVVRFAPGDPENPRNWSSWRKWIIVAALSFVDLTVSFAASGFSPVSKKFTKEFNVGAEVGVLGLSLYVLGLAWGPMLNAPLSEAFGRNALYIISYAIFLLLLMSTALVTNLGAFLFLRTLSGLFSSVTVANFGGTIADMWPRDQVGPAMSLFLWAGVGGSSMGFFLLSFVAQTRGWRDVFWALLGICGGSWLIMTVVLLPGNETRHNVLLRRRAKRLQRETGSDVDVPEEARHKDMAALFKVTLTRPFRFLFTEAIIMFAALYNGYLYGLSFMFNDAFSLVFGPKGHGFSTIGVGLVFLALVFGIGLGPLVNIWQESYYQKRIRVGLSSDQQREEAVRLTKDQQLKNVPEARLQLAKIAAITLSVSLWWFAWTCEPSYNIHFMVPVVAMGLFGWSFYTLILMTYLYVEDSYMVFSASALAGVAFIRNLAGACFPLFGAQLYENQGYNRATTILAFLSMLLIPIPFVLEKYGTKLRARSPWARQHMDDDDSDDDADDNRA